MWDTLASVAPMPLAPANGIKWHNASTSILQMATALKYCEGGVTLTVSGGL